MREKMATREAYGKALVNLGRNNAKIVVLDADLSKSTKTVLFAEEFPLRFFDMGVAEADMPQGSQLQVLYLTSALSEYLRREGFTIRYAARSPIQN